MELDTLYSFKLIDGKISKPKSNLKMKDCQEIIIKINKDTRENGFSFKINMGDKIVHIMAD